MWQVLRLHCVQVPWSMRCWSYRQSTMSNSQPLNQATSGGKVCSREESELNKWSQEVYIQISGSEDHDDTWCRTFQVGCGKLGFSIFCLCQQGSCNSSSASISFWCLPRSVLELAQQAIPDAILQDGDWLYRVTWWNSCGTGS